MSHHHHHHHGHDHHGHQHFDMQREGNQKGLLIALCITAGIMILEFIGGLVTNSLALLSDSGHMLSDTSSLALSLVAIWFANRAASSEKTYGYYRFEVLAALFNGVTLFVIAGFIIYEAYERVLNPQTVASGTMMIIAAIGLGANLLSAWSLLRQGDVKDNVNLRSAYLHVLGDALGSVGALVAGLLMLLFNWYIADPIISVVVALLILKSAWGVLTHSFHILMEGSPAHVDINKIKELLKEIDGVKGVHDIHVWTITSGLHSFSCHLQVSDDQDCQAILQKALNLVNEQCGIEHSTIQVEKSGLEHGELKV
ncbi:zinc transporter ZitB [Bacillus sp. VT 712]|uniref:Zinc transporter ZitB n=2 Tax=Priestia TaxID=2800373 RepID=A0A0V8JHL3_9BACI|nr:MULTISPECIES: cation diffusion facilitator family transporter [Bacillaceae]KSU86460.1 zinc transporter ZitB [Priestia veravalensis]KZB90566.1 zinc transporter ZitB [Bacillus sp. VT 712]MBY6087991.1 cation diffusion facilitator family transporter [Priestia flexa]MCA1202959.1 cation diffusion facilitator family transporter [Priestia flexa]MCG7314248.1 cation diffusion facilitator family transporter [Priestia flexa]